MTTNRLAIDQSSAPQQVANALRDLLLNGEIPPGVRLREVPLADEIGVSRHTLRSGFRILEAEGLLNQRLHKGVTVAELTADRIADVFRARKALEFSGVYAIDLEPADGREDVVEQLEVAVKRMRSARNDTELAAADLDFHSSVVAAIGSRMIDELYRNVQAQLRLTRAWALRTRGDSQLMAKTHGLVAELLRERQRDEAAKQLMSINDVGETRLLGAMEELDTSGPRPLVWPPDTE